MLKNIAQAHSVHRIRAPLPPQDNEWPLIIMIIVLNSAQNHPAGIIHRDDQLLFDSITIDVRCSIDLMNLKAIHGGLKPKKLFTSFCNFINLSSPLHLLKYRIPLLITDSRLDRTLI